MEQFDSSEEVDVSRSGSLEAQRMTAIRGNRKASENGASRLSACQQCILPLCVSAARILRHAAIVANLFI